MQKRENFGSRFAVIMAMAGSAIGLGNIWRFPYMVGEGGGAAFIIIYLISTLVLSMPIFFSESIIGRCAQSGTIGAMEQLAPGSKWKWLGYVTIISPLILVSYYSVVGGWSFEFMLKAFALDFNGSSPEGVKQMFGNFISRDWAPLICHTIFIGLTCLIVLAGVRKGIEAFSKLTMPVLFILIVLIMFYSVSLPGSAEGLQYMLKPDFSKIDGRCITSAMGQSFFSLSLGVGTILTYSSFVKKDEDLLGSGLGTAFFDLMFAMLAGFAVMPAVFAAGIEPGAGPGLIFETLPFIFAKMGTGAPLLSAIAAILFFVAVFVAALTSSISMVQVGVSYLMEQKGLSKGKSVALIFLGTWTLGVLCSLSFGRLGSFHILGCSIFDFCDKLVSNYLMAIGGLFFTLFVGWKMNPQTVREEFTGKGSRRLNSRIYPAVRFLIRWVAPLGIIVIFLSNLFL